MIEVRFLFNLATTSSKPTLAQDYMDNESNYVDLGLFCAEVCETLYEGYRRKRL